LLDDADYWLSHGNGEVQGFYAVDEATPSLNSDAYGIDVYTQSIRLAQDWELLGAFGGTPIGTPI
jgi:hypothetical protein